MESLLVVVLCVCLAGQVLGLPHTAVSDTVLPSRRVSGEQSSGNEHDVKESSFAMPLTSQVLKRSPSENEGVEASDLGKPALFDDSKMKMEEKKELTEEKAQMPDLPEPKLNLRFPDAGQPVAEIEDKDNVRAKKSTSMQDTQYSHGPHTTTVCIQVRSDHQPGVICGNPLSDVKKEGDPSIISPTKPRFAYRSPNDYYPHTYNQPPMPYMASPIQSSFFRASPQDSPGMISGRPSPVNQVSLSPKKSSILNQRPSPMSPKVAARGSLPVSMYPLRRSDEDPNPKIGDSTLPQGPGSTPIRINPQNIIPSPNPMVVHKPYYPPSYLQGYLPNLIAPSASSPLRLNCATEGGVIPYLRSGPPVGYLPIEERLIVNPVGARMAENAQYSDGQQVYFMDPEAKQDISDNIVGSPYSPDGLSGTLFIDEDGQTYIMHDTQGRSAVNDQMMYEQDQFLGEEPTEDLAMKTRHQQEELQRSNERLEELTKQLKDIKKKVAVDTEKKDTKKELQEMAKDPKSDSNTNTPEKKSDPPKNAKRNVFRQF